jgi:peptidoglycan/xylan/chitin deacetylase (PgdA/CDA1 family)
MLCPLATGICVGLGAVGAVGLVAGGCAYAALSPGSKIFGRTLIAARRPDELALTFDDGPNPAWTPRLLDILAAYSVRATFFMIGNFVQAEPALVRRVAEEGHLIGNHSWSHPNLARTPANLVVEELARTCDVLEQRLGKPVRFFRPPYGARRRFVLRTARDLGMTPVTWNAMTSDWSAPSADRIAEQLMSKIETNRRRGWASNIVLHDGGHRALGTDRGPSVTAAGQLLAHYKTTRNFVTLDAWAPALAPSS